jgi:putative heme-binding domain-containing protein
MKQADLQRGREVFQLACASCHKLYGEGGTIGPELTGSDRQNLDYLLDNILSPSSVVPEAYRVSNISLKDERVLSGIVLSRTEQNVALQTLTDNVSVPRAEIDSIQESELSMMPDGLLETLAEQQIIDLIGYLQSSSPAPAPPVKR